MSRFIRIPIIIAIVIVLGIAFIESFNLWTYTIDTNWYGFGSGGL